MSAQQQTLADLLEESLRHLPNAARTGRLRKEAVKDVLPTKIALHNAKKFVISDELASTITLVSKKSTVDDVLARFPSATLPYPVMWMEMSFNVVGSIEYGDEEPGENEAYLGPMGLLFVRSPRNPAAWSMDFAMNVTGHYTSIKKITSSTMLASYGFSPSGVADLPPRHDAPFHSYTTLTDKGRELFGPLIGTAWGVTDNPERTLRPELVDATFIAVSSPHISHAATSSLEQLAGVAKYQNLMSWGILRWAVTALSMLSEVPDLIHAEESGGSVARQSGGKSGYSFHRLTLHIPNNKDPVRYIKRKLDHAVAARMRAHEVRGHWRNYHLVEGCEHTWQQADEDPTYRRCTSCGAFSRFISEHVRGDETLGWVRKEYILAGAKA